MMRQQFNFHVVDAIDSVDSVTLIKKQKTIDFLKVCGQKCPISVTKKQPKQRQTLKNLSLSHRHARTYAHLPLLPPSPPGE